MFGNNYFYDIPIYRISSDKWDRDWEKYLHTHLYISPGISKGQIDEFYKRNPDSKIIYTQHAWESFGGPWRYNEIIGYIRLYFLGDQVRGEFWLTKSKRIVKTRKKIIVCLSHKVVPEKTIPRDANNYEIFELVMAYIGEAKKYLKKWFIDSKNFEKIGKYIDWRSLIHLQ